MWPLGPALVAALVIGLACRTDEGAEQTVVITFRTPTATVEPTATATTTATATPTATSVPNVCAANPDPAPPSVLQVQEPEAREQVGVPFHVRGWGSNIGFQDIGVAVAVIDARQDVLELVEGPPLTRSNRVLPRGMENTEFTRPFAVDIVITGLGGPTPFCVWVFVETDEDGNPQDVVQVPIVVAP